MAGYSIRLGEPRWCVVRGYYDGSGVIAAYGPVDTEDDAKRLIAELGELGLSDKLEVVPFFGIDTRELDW